MGGKGKGQEHSTANQLAALKLANENQIGPCGVDGDIRKDFAPDELKMEPTQLSERWFNPKLSSCSRRREGRNVYFRAEEFARAGFPLQRPG